MIEQARVETLLTATLPVITAPAVTDTTQTTVTLGANILSTGDLILLGTGVVLAPTSVNPNPQIGGTGVTNV